MKEIVVLVKPYELNSIVMQWVSAFATCAIEGNTLGIEMMELWNNGQLDAFAERLEKEWQPELRKDYQKKSVTSFPKRQASIATITH